MTKLGKKTIIIPWKAHTHSDSFSKLIFSDRKTEFRRITSLLDN